MVRKDHGAFSLVQQDSSGENPWLKGLKDPSPPTGGEGKGEGGAGAVEGEGGAKTIRMNSGRALLFYLPTSRLFRTG